MRNRYTVNPKDVLRQPERVKYYRCRDCKKMCSSDLVHDCTKSAHSSRPHVRVIKTESSFDGVGKNGRK